MPLGDTALPTESNYERSYKSMWEEIGRARMERDAAIKLMEAGRDLAIAIRHDMGTGTKVSEPVLKALARMELYDNG